MGVGTRWVMWLGVAALTQLAPERLPPGCRAMLAAGGYAEAEAVCRREAEAGDLASAFRLATVLMGLERWAEAKDAATPLLVGPLAADAAYIAGVSAAMLDDLGTGSALLHDALTRHEQAGARLMAARDAFDLAGLARDQGEQRVARELLERAARHAREGGDVELLAYIELGTADLWRLVGETAEAERALQRALDANPTPTVRASILLQLGQAHILGGRYALAMNAFETTLELERGAGSPRPSIMGSALLNLSFLARHGGRVHAALALVEEAARYGIPAMEVELNRGAALALSTVPADLATAERYLGQAEVLGPSGDWSWYVPHQRGLLAERRGAVDEALAAYDRAIAANEVLRDKAGELAASVVATYRESHLRKVGLLARWGRWDDVLEVVARLDVNDALRVEVAPRSVSPSAAAVADSGSPALPTVQPGRRLTSGAAIVEAWRGRTLVVLVSDTEVVWRLVITNGSAIGSAVGTVSTLERFARDLDAPLAAYDELRPIAEELAQAIVPPGAAEADVLLVGALARTPLALVAAAAPGRPRLVRVLGVVPMHGDPRGAPRGASVLGDPEGNLPAARIEAIRSARTLGVRPRLGIAATSAALAEAQDVAVLHIASHAVVEPTGAKLRLADRSISAPELRGFSFHARVVVLASCGGAAARDDAGWGSLAAAFLSAGAEYVIASPWTVGDEATRRFVASFYRLGGARTPVTALSAAQDEIAASGAPPGEWAGFVVLRRPPVLL